MRHMLSLMCTKRRCTSDSQKLSPLAFTMESRRASVIGRGSLGLSWLMGRVKHAPCTDRCTGVGLYILRERQHTSGFTPAPQFCGEACPSWHSAAEALTHLWASS